MSLEGEFARVSATLVAEDETVEHGRMLQAPGLKTFGKFFAFVTREELYVKLPAARVDALIASGTGRPCELRNGSPMREWVRLAPNDQRR